MKKLFLLLTLFMFAFAANHAFAAVTPTPTKSATRTSPTPSTNAITQIDQQINNLKDKIASRVAQLKLVEKKGIVGIVTDVSGTQITLKDINGNTQFVDVDELTSFSSPSVKSNFGISDISKNMNLGVLGIYNKESRRILGRFVNVTILPQHITGAIADIDKKNFTITVTQDSGKQQVIEIEDVTKVASYDSTTGTVKSGFSKMIVGERVYAVGYSDKQDTTQLIASRVIIFPSLPVNPSIANTLPETPTAPVSPTFAPTMNPLKAK